jgi:hypothetical protein
VDEAQGALELMSTASGTQYIRASVLDVEQGGCGEIDSGGWPLVQRSGCACRAIGRPLCRKYSPLSIVQRERELCATVVGLIASRPEQYGLLLHTRARSLRGVVCSKDGGKAEGSREGLRSDMRDLRLARSLRIE